MDELVDANAGKILLDAQNASFRQKTEDVEEFQAFERVESSVEKVVSKKSQAG